MAKDPREEENQAAKDRENAARWLASKKVQDEIDRVAAQLKKEHEAIEAAKKKAEEDKKKN